MPQTQKTVELQFKNGSKSRAIATGNNAAWICCRADPLLGRSGAIKGVSEAFRIDCPYCGRKYFVEPNGKNQGAVLRVIEVD